MKEINLNKVKVNPVITNDVSYTDKNLKSFKMFPSLYYNLFICSKKKSGKTSLISNILNKATDKRTTIWLFCATYGVDSTWKAIIKTLREKGYTVNCYDSILEGRVNHLDIIIEELSVESEEEEDEPIKKRPKKKEPIKSIFETKNILKFNDDGLFAVDDETKDEFTEEPVRKPRKPKKDVPKHLFVFDDISTEMRNKSIARLLKIHRHLKSSVICSSQYLNDLHPMSILQLDYFICFKSMSEEKMEKIHKLLDLAIDLDKFWNIYHYATKDKYNFLYVNCRTEEIRKNFNRQIIHD